jgi:hypothetical protein
VERNLRARWQQPPNSHLIFHNSAEFPLGLAEQYRAFEDFHRLRRRNGCEATAGLSTRSSPTQSLSVIFYAYLTAVGDRR